MALSVCMGCVCEGAKQGIADTSKDLCPLTTNSKWSKQALSGVMLVTSVERSFEEGGKRLSMVS